VIYDCRNFKDNFIFILHSFINGRVTDAPVNRQYDLAVIGSGPAGQKAAIQGAKLGKRVAVIDRATCVGGICIHHGAIPSKSLREAILYFYWILSSADLWCPAL
jgi:Pyridine nucleotide-disulphide oxidoreductase